MEGYNTLDALASVAFSVIAVTTLNQLGFKNKKEYISTIWIVGLIVALAFSAMYIGLGYLGNHFPVPAEVIAKGNPGVYVLSQATQAIFGPTAQIFLAVMVTVTCFTTTAGLIVSTGEFFNNTFPKVSYKTLLALGITAPECTSHTCNLHSLDKASVHQVRTTAKIGEIALACSR